VNEQIGGLSPWAHPKAQEWFEAVFKRSGIIENIENSLTRHAKELTVERLRALVSLLILLGRPGVWPSDQVLQLRKMVQMLVQLRADAAHVKRAQTIEGHQQMHQLLANLDEELDILRRQTGVSRRIVSASRPRTWSKFWQ
jgi:hypothetical protein